MTNNYPPNTLTDYFEKINSITNFDFWFSGHYHLNRQCTGKHFMIFDNIVQITSDGYKIVSGEAF